MFLVAVGGKEINVALLRHELGLHDLVVLLSNQSLLALGVYAELGLQDLEVLLPNQSTLAMGVYTAHLRHQLGLHDLVVLLPNHSQL